MVVSGNDADTHAYTLAEVKQLTKVIALEDPKSGDTWKHTMRAAFMIAMFTGLRLEEIKGLKWRITTGRTGCSTSGAPWLITTLSKTQKRRGVSPGACSENRC